MSTFSDGATSDASSSNSKGPLVQKIREINVSIGEELEGKKAVSDERVAWGAKGESETEEVVEEGASSGVEDVGEHNVHSVFGTNGACTKHCETELHGEYKVGREKKEGGVDGVGGGGEVR